MVGIIFYFYIYFLNIFFLKFSLLNFMSRRQMRQRATVGADWQNCLWGMLRTIFCTRLAHQYRHHWVKGKNSSPSSSLQNWPANIVSGCSGRRATRPLFYETGPPVPSLLGDGEEERATVLFATKLACQYHHWVKGKKTQSSSLYMTGLPVSSLLGGVESSLQNWLASIIIGWRGIRASPSSGPSGNKSFTILLHPLCLVSF